MKATTKRKFGSRVLLVAAIIGVIVFAAKTITLTKTNAATTFADTLSAKIRLIVNYSTTGEIDWDVLKQHPELSGFIAKYRSECNAVIEKKAVERKYNSDSYVFFSTVKSRIH